MTASTAFQSIAEALTRAVADGGIDAWYALLSELNAGLTGKDKAKLVFIVLSSLEPEIAYAVAKHCVPRAGMPIAPLFNYMDEAAFWADMASPEELEAYCLACFSAMRPDRRAAFLNFIHGSAAA